MSDNIDIPVLIIGGGPAGLATSLVLTSRGVEHFIIEPTHLSQHKIGEAIPPNSIPLLKKLGLHAQLTKNHLEYHGNKVLWGNQQVKERLFITEKYQTGFILNRSVFENDLRHKTKANWLYGSCISCEDKGSFYRIRFKTNSGVHQLACQYIVDASGKKSIIAKALQIKQHKIDDGAALVFKSEMTIQPESFVHIESFSNGWIYMSPTPQKHLSIMIFTDLDLMPPSSQTELYIRSTIDQTKLIKKQLHNDFSIRNPKVRPSNTTYLEKISGTRWVAVGDAAYSFDPISSYGITSALASGFYGGHALADTLNGKQNAMIAYHHIMDKTFKKYLHQLFELFSQETRWQSNTFWKRRMRF